MFYKDVVNTNPPLGESILSPKITQGEAVVNMSKALLPKCTTAYSRKIKFRFCSPISGGHSRQIFNVLLSVCCNGEDQQATLNGLFYKGLKYDLLNISEKLRQKCDKDFAYAPKGLRAILS
jgi:hypothetical protein